MVSVTTVPAGDFSVMSRSALNVCRMKFVSRTRPIIGPAPDTVMFEVATASGSGLGVSVEG